MATRENVNKKEKGLLYLLLVFIVFGWLCTVYCYNAKRKKPVEKNKSNKGKNTHVITFRDEIPVWLSLSSPRFIVKDI